MKMDENNSALQFIIACEMIDELKEEQSKLNNRLESIKKQLNLLYTVKISLDLDTLKRTYKL